MDITFYINNSPQNKIGKSLSSSRTISGTLRDVCNVTNPEILVESSSFPDYNYLHIPAFGRYYFIKEIQSYRNNLWTVSARVDVLESFKSEIRGQSVILEDSGSAGKNPYISNNAYVAMTKTKTDIVNFPSGLLSDGVYILITAGGVAAI